MTEQQLTELAISNFLKTNDACARQYQIHRRNALEVSQLVQAEMANGGEISAATKSRLHQVQFDNMKMNVQYKAHMQTLQRNMGVFKHPGQTPDLDGQTPDLDGQKPYLDGQTPYLDSQISEISRKNDAISHEVNRMASMYRPVVDKLSLLVKNFENRVTIKNSKISRDTMVASKGEGENSAENAVLLTYDASVFSRAELDALFAPVTKRLASLKTVDEISNKPKETEKGGEKDETIESESNHIDVSKHLAEHLQNSRAYTRLDDGSYSYDISKSASVDVGSVSMSIQEYAQAIDVLVRDIQDLVVRGAEAKERWVLNARKIEIMQSLLDDSMDTDLS